MKPSAPSDFWEWVIAHAPALRDGNGRDAPILDELLASLHAYCPELYFQIGGHPGGPTELIITAEGKRSAFDAVRTLVDAAPALPSWEFIAFKPPRGFAFTTEHGRARINASESWFMPLESNANPELFGLRLACAEYDADTDDDFRFAAYQVIDEGLGEIAAATHVHHIEVERTPPEPAARGYIELPELAAYIARRARRAGG